MVKGRAVAEMLLDFYSGRSHPRNIRFIPSPTATIFCPSDHGGGYNNLSTRNTLTESPCNKSHLELQLGLELTN